MPKRYTNTKISPLPFRVIIENNSPKQLSNTKISKYSAQIKFLFLVYDAKLEA